MSRARIKGAGALAVLWVIVCLSGLGLLVRYKARPGNPGDPPPRWPSAAGLALAADRPTMIMTVHPHCPCTRASLAELDEVMRRAPEGVVAYVLFVLPPGVADGWERGELWDRARTIPGVRVVADRGGALGTGAFRLAVSGHVLVYDAAGALRFSGGITGSRGHVGDNVGRERVLALLSGGDPDAATSHVFGCALEEEGP